MQLVFTIPTHMYFYPCSCNFPSFPCILTSHSQRNKYIDTGPHHPAAAVINRNPSPEAAVHAGVQTLDQYRNLSVSSQSHTPVKVSSSQNWHKSTNDHSKPCWIYVKLRDQKRPAGFNQLQVCPRVSPWRQPLRSLENLLFAETLAHPTVNCSANSP